MDVNKSTPLANNPWVLCPSKSLPGKFYYFNVQNGEAVWSLNCKEKSGVGIKTNNSVTYTTAPLIHSPVKTSANIAPNPSQDHRPSLQRSISQNTPIFGQNTPLLNQLGNFTANPQQFMPVPNIVWTPVQIPILSYVTSDTRTSLSETRFERVIETAQMDKKCLVHSSGVPLCHRFVNFKSSSTSYKENNYNKFVPSSPQYSNSHMHQFQNQIPNSNPEFPESLLNGESQSTINTEPKSPDHFGTEISENEIPKNIPDFRSFVNMKTEAVKIDVSQLTNFGTKNFVMEVSESGIPKYIPASSNTFLNAEEAIANNLPTKPIPMEFSNKMEAKNHIPKYTPETTKSFSNTVTEPATLHSSPNSCHGSLIFESNPNSSDKEKIYVSPCDNVKNPMLNNLEQEENLKHLSSTDLRFQLLAKRRKLEADGLLGCVEKKKPKLQENLQKKKVTFNLDNLPDDNGKNEKVVCNFSPNINYGDFNMKISSNNASTNCYKRLTSTENMQNNISVNNNSVVTINNIPINTSKSYNTEEKIWMVENTNYDTTVTENTHVNKITKDIDKDNSEEKNKDKTTISINNSNYIPMEIDRNIRIYNTPNLIEKLINSQGQTMTDNQKLKSDFNVQTHGNISNIPFQMKINDDIKNSDGFLNKTDIKIPSKSIDGTPCLKRNESCKDSSTFFIGSSTSYTYKNIWYLVVDLDVLLDDHMLVDKLVKSDEKCRLLVPKAICRELEALCIGDCRGQQRVLIARQISRRIDGLDKRIIVEPTPNNEELLVNTTDLILKCCVNALRDNYYVVLLTNDGYLRNRANSLNIRCYTPQDIKNNVIIAPKLFAELKK